MQRVTRQVVAAFILGSIGLAVVPPVRGQQLTNPKAIEKADTLSADPANLLPPPNPKSTVFGGAIHSVDPVRDQLTLNAAGLRPMKILFDERTQFFVDGKKMPLRSLRPTDHASVQTALDGTDIFAVSIHVLSQSPEGDYQGRVLRYNPNTGQLTISGSRSREPFNVFVAPNSTFVRQGQPAFAAMHSGPSDLAPGSLVSVTFESGDAGHGMAKQITVLAVPGASFQFSGTISALDLAAGSMVLLDPRDGQSYQVYFNPRLFPESRNLRIGSQVAVTASYNGTQYQASQLATR
jgi:hypothetical protein